MKITNASLKRRILEISYNHKLSHLGSCLTAVDIIYEIFQRKSPEEKFILSSGHAGLALYVILESKGGKNAESVFRHHGVHPDRCRDCGIDCSSGSLGQGLPIAVGMALADRTKNVYCLISDGECAEGSIWEALRIASEQQLTNLKVYVNWNGWAAFRPSTEYIDWGPRVTIHNTTVEQLPFLKGQDAHYYTMTKEDYELAQNILR
jgi:transketolase